MAAAIAALPLRTVAQQAGETHLQTAFIYQFTNYIEWPAEKLAGSDFVICVAEDSPLVQDLKDLAKTKTIKGKPLRICTSSDIKELRKSQIVIVNAGSGSQLAEISHALKGSSALVVSFGSGLAGKGATISFFLDDGRLRFEICRAAAEKEHLQIGAQLLKLAKLVD